MSKRPKSVTVDDNVRFYRQGKVMPSGGVFLGSFRAEGFKILPWVSKEVFRVFNVHVGERMVPCVQVIVSKEEWDAWIAFEKHKTPLPDKFNVFIDDDNDEDAPKVLKHQKKDPLEKARIEMLKLLKRRFRFLRREAGLLALSAELERARAEKKLREEARQKELQEKAKRIALRKEKVSKPREYVEPPPRRQPKLLPQEIVPNNEINGNKYDLRVRIIGNMIIFTSDLANRMRLYDGIYPARLAEIPVGDTGMEKCIMIRYPIFDGKVEYGLTVRQWQSYVEGRYPGISVSIAGFDFTK